MITPEDIQSIGELPSAARNKLPLAPGDDMADFPWRNMKNLRLQVQGNYVFWKTRGGSTLVNSFFGNVLTVYPIQAELSGVVTEFLAVHTASGKVYLWNISAGTSDEIAASGFSTTNQIQFTNVGRFLFMFDYDGGKSAYYDLSKEALFDFLSYDKAYISAVNWLAPGLETQDDNIFNFKTGEDIIVFPNAVTSDGIVIYTPGAEGSAGTINPSLYNENSFLYTYNGGKYLIDAEGKEYKQTQFFTFSENAAPFAFTVGGDSGDDFTIERLYIPLNEAGNADFSSFVTKIDTAEEGLITFKDPTGVRLSTQFGGVTDFNGSNIILPYNPDMEDLVGLPSFHRLSSDGSEIIEDDRYNAPKAFRQYVLFDLLNDGSVTVTGLPFQLEAGQDEILGDGASRVNFTITAPSANVEKRFLTATRWQPSKEKAFNPVSEEYPNSPLFIVGEVNKDRVFVKDETPDHKLFRGIGELQDLIAGISNLFGSGSLKPNNVAQFTGSLLMSGYTVSRPIPIPYTNAAGATDGNIFVNFTSTEQLPNNMALAIMFGYSDGRRSNIVETEQFFQKGSTVVTEPSSCGQTKASGGHEVTGGATEDGDLDISYEGVTVRVPLTVASHSSPAAVAEAIRQDLVADADIRVIPAVPSGGNIEYTEKRYGEEFNTNEVVVSPVPVAAEAEIDVTANNLFIGASEGWIDVTANNLAASSSENHTIDVGANSTDPIAINDTDTFEDIVDKYVAEINSTAAISADWTASKVDLGGGEWRCLLTADTNDETFNGVVIDVAGQNDVTVSIETPTSGGNDGEETHTITVGANTTAGSTILSTDTPEQIVDKYVADINGDGTISADWTASKVDLGGGEWRCLLTSDTPGASDNGVAVSVNVSGEVSGGTEVAFTVDSPTSGGSDGAGVTFDDASAVLTGAGSSPGNPAQIWISLRTNGINSGSESNQFVIIADGGGNVAPVNGWTVRAGDSPRDVMEAIAESMESSSDWEVTTDYPLVILTSKHPGDLSWNGLHAQTQFGEEYGKVTYNISAPGLPVTVNEGETAGAGDPCTSATAKIQVDSNNISTGTENHTITIDGNSTDPVEVSDSDTSEDIVDKYISAIQADNVIDLEWKSEKVDEGSGVFSVLLTHRQLGTGGNNKVVDVTGETDVSFTITSPSSGGTNSDDEVVGSAEQVFANQVQVHSLNSLVSRVYLLGRTTDGGTSYHLVREIEITAPEAHGMVINLPDTEAELTEIEADLFTEPPADDVLETVELQNYQNVGTPFQQFAISTQEPIVDDSRIMRAIPVGFDSDKSTMRYRVLIFTDKNIQLGYLTDTTVNGRRIFTSNFEVVFGGMIASSRFGISDVLGSIVWETKEGVYAWGKTGTPDRLFDVRKYDVSAGNNLLDVVYNTLHKELWLIYGSTEIVVYDFTSGSTRRMSYSGVGSIRAGAFFGEKLYIGGGTDVIETDLPNEMIDLAGGASVTGSAETTHIGDELTQIRLVELTIGGQQFSAQVEVDLQNERKEDDAGAWSDDFDPDVNLGSKTLKMSGASYQIQRIGIMPRIRVSFPAVAGGIVSHAILNRVTTENRGIARK